MIQTKHDLSAGIAKLNLKELQKLASIAVSFTKRDCERGLNELQVSPLEGEYRDVMYNSIHLAESAEALRQSAIALYYLQEAETREEIIIDIKE